MQRGVKCMSKINATEPQLRNSAAKIGKSFENSGANPQHTFKIV